MSNTPRQKYRSGFCCAYSSLCLLGYVDPPLPFVSVICRVDVSLRPQNYAHWTIAWSGYNSRWSAIGLLFWNPTNFDRRRRRCASFHYAGALNSCFCSVSRTMRNSLSVVSAAIQRWMKFLLRIICASCPIKYRWVSIRSQHSKKKR